MTVTLRLQPVTPHAHRQQRAWRSPWPEPTCQRRHRACAAYTGSSSSSSSSGRHTDGQDLVGGLLDTCLATCSCITEAIISRSTDLLLSIAPEGAPRQKVETSVKGALLLLVLGLLKGVIDFVLLVGTVGLVLYTATHVFGWNTVLLGLQQGSATGYARHPGAQSQPHHQRQQQYSSHRAAAAGQQGYGAVPQQAQQQQQQPAPWEAWRHPPQQDVVDVFYGKQQFKQQ